MKNSTGNSAAILAVDVPARVKPSNYPAPFATRMEGRVKRQLGDAFQIQKFGVNLTELAPGAQSSLFHRHTKQEEFIYIISGFPTLVLDREEIKLAPGMCAGFTPEQGAHQLVNRSEDLVTYLEIGDRVAGDEGSYPRDDLVAVLGSDGKWIWTHKDGRPY